MLSFPIEVASLVESGIAGLVSKRLIEESREAVGSTVCLTAKGLYTSMLPRAGEAARFAEELLTWLKARAHKDRGAFTHFTWQDLRETGLADEDLPMAAMVIDLFRLSADHHWDLTSVTGRWAVPLDLDQLRKIHDINGLLARVENVACPPAAPSSHDSTSSEWEDDVTAYRGRVHFAIITVKAEEEDEILERFPRQHSVRGQRFYSMCRTENVRGEQLLVASVRQPGQGNIHASTITRDLIADLDPAWILLVGIAGASPFGDAILGDVVLGTHVHDLTVHARNADGSSTFSAKGGAATPEVEATVVHARSTLAKVMHFPTPQITLPPSPTFTTSDEEVNKRISASLKTKRSPKILDGPIISTDALVKDVELVKTWRDVMRNALAIEMESAGAYGASRTLSKTYAVLAIRGISDIVGLDKQEHAVAHACSVAAECALQFVRQWSPPSSTKGVQPLGARTIGGSNIVSINQMGGQIAHTITNVGAQPRVISPAAAQALATALRSLQAANVEVRALMTDAESAQFGKQLAAVLRAGGWTVHETTFVPRTAIAGVVMCVHERTLALDTLNGTLQQLGVRAVGELQTEPIKTVAGKVVDAIVIVGSNLA